MFGKIKEFINSYYGKGVIDGFFMGLQFCLVLLLVLQWSGVLNSNSTELNGSDADREVGRVEANQQAASVEVGNAAAASREAQSSIERAGAGVGSVQIRIDRSAELVGYSKSQIDSISDGLKECRELARKSERILRELEATAGG